MKNEFGELKKTGKEAVVIYYRISTYYYGIRLEKMGETGALVQVISGHLQKSVWRAKRFREQRNYNCYVCLGPD